MIARILVGLGIVVGISVMAGAAEVSPTPLVHGLASFVLPGLGQYLNGEPQKALTHFLTDVVLVVASAYTGYLLPYPLPLYLGLVPLVWHVYSAVDAYETALCLEDPFRCQLQR